MHMDRGGPYQCVVWDMSVCHTWYNVAADDGNVFEGPNNQSSIWAGDDPPPHAAPPPPGMCWNTWIPGPCSGG
jgi:hypothetical protein